MLIHKYVQHVFSRMKKRYSNHTLSLHREKCLPTDDKDLQ